MANDSFDHPHADNPSHTVGRRMAQWGSDKRADERVITTARQGAMVTVAAVRRGKSGKALFGRFPPAA
jgi:hypothetical protein